MKALAGVIGEVSAVKSCWFNHTGLGTCQVPENWRIPGKEHWEGEPISNRNEYTDHKDRCNITGYNPVKMEAIWL